ncbi:TonB-dependent receptor [Flavivirga abyssicola]|uniref:TonB-dependent receptor n=1 Tax=Flavivirga abyssicola TaxID=3063533 RepID=UPI0026DFA902|nr:TonB-dependent receptor [Flavivirga sp. MEBiC07777]WVK14477.1 TonB-dependent receptor [Flavivirga sp. MEBiC07777]
MKTILKLFILCLTCSLQGQTGIIKGLVIDKQSEIPLPGATVELLNQDKSIGVITNENGYFTLKNVPLGRQAIRISYVGYEPLTLPNLDVTSGKDVAVNASLAEAFGALDAVILTTETNKDRAVNKLASISARQFSMEEVNRFSGGRSDVGRLASNFAGVSAPDDSRNDIVVRGNSPSGLLWRLEGVPIPNPNHFSSLGATGSPVSALNPNMLKNSDFITSAFPAEYGNALGGVFDLGFRKGNTDDYEFTTQVGVFTGFEAMAEGPLGNKQGSFLVAGRYSLIGLVGGGGTSATPNYSDISYNIDLGTGTYGNLSLFGIIGNSDIDFYGDDIEKDDLFAAEDENSFVKSNFNVFGFNHRITIGKKSYLKTVASISGSGNNYTEDRFIEKNTPNERIIKYTESDNKQNRITISSLFNSKLNSKITLRTGVLFENIKLKSYLQDRDEQPDLNNDGDPDLFTFRNTNESLNLFQPYVQGRFRLSKKLTLNAGLHSQYSSLNSQFVIEPRAALNYKIAPKHSLSLGYGMHHQNIPLPILFLNEDVNGELVQTNKNLKFTRSDHYVLGYDVKLAKSWRAKAEVYYQNITKAAVEPFPSSYSSLTEGADFDFNNSVFSLKNEGKGHNQGVELTVEKFFSNGFYGLLTSSFFESKYKGSDGIERNSPFNNGYVTNLLAGKEITVGKAQKNVLFFDTRFTVSGGRYYTPADLEASRLEGFEVLLEDQAFSKQHDNYMRWDFKVGFKINSKRKKLSHQFFVDLQNLTNRKNIFERRYNRLTNNIDRVDQIGFFPDVGYRFQF